MSHERPATSTILRGCLALSLFVFGYTTALAGQTYTPPGGVAPAGEIIRPGHFGREIGNIESIIHFYHDLLGNGLLVERNQSFKFFATQPLTDFVSSPREAEYRAVNMPIPGTSPDPGKVDDMTIEAIEFRNIERHQYMPGLQDSGVSNFVFIMRHLDSELAKLKKAGVLVITAGGEPVTVKPLPGLAGSARAVMVRDPDGYPVELMQLTPIPENSASATSNIIGSHLTLVVDDIEATEAFYRNLIGPDLRTWVGPPFHTDKGLNKLRNTPGGEVRLGSMLIPGSGTIMEFIQYRNISGKAYRPDVRDIGAAHVALMVKDIEVIMKRLKSAGVKTLGRNGGWYNLNPDVRALYTRDPNGFFVEMMERKSGK